MEATSPRVDGSRKVVGAIAFLLIMLISGTARAETISGTFTFSDSDGTSSPIRFATVEIWRFRPGPFGWWAWYADKTVSTNAFGRINEPMNFIQPGVVYGLRVFAKNRGVTVKIQDLYSPDFFRKPGEPGTAIEKRVNAASDVLDFSFNFADTYATNHFNIADAILHGFDYATALPRRTPGFDDDIAPVTVLLAGIGLTYYDPGSHLLRLNTFYAMDDFSILHEYAHYLEERISSFLGLASYHDGCIAVAGAIDLASAGLSWMEGFASYFPQAVNRTVPGALQFAPNMSVPLGSTPAQILESPSCPGSMLPLHATEDFVGGALFDIIDGMSSSEPNDRLCRTSDNPIDNKVFQVFDSIEVGFANPTLQNFVDGWVNHGFDLPSLLSAFGATATGLTTPNAVLRYDSSPAANYAIWRPADGNWWIIGGQSGPVTQWGQRGDIPVAADYDGDGFTDVAVYRPDGGNWFVILSRTNRIQVTQWGLPYDIPLPGDYDGDNEVDYAVYRPGSGEVIVHVDGCGMVQRFSFPGVLSGTPVVGDFNGDGRDEPALYVRETNTFHRAFGAGTMQVGYAGTPVIGDYDGDGKSDFAVYAAGTWYIRNSSSSQILTASFGGWLDVPVPADYNGDGTTEIAVWTPTTGYWKINPGLRMPIIYQQWGQAGDVPVPRS
jgi:hypothetical protein